MQIKMRAVRRMYDHSRGCEYVAGQEFTVDSENDADRLVRRSKAERVGGAVVQEQPAGDGELTAARVEYQEVSGKRPFHGWDTPTLREKIGEYRTRHLTAEK